MGMRTLLVVPLLLLAACGEATVDAPPAGDPDQLAGRTFVGSDVTGHDLVAGSELRLEFKQGDLNVNAGCNHLFATYDVDGDTLRADGFGGTDMGCDPRRMEQDTWVSEFLSSRPTIDLGDHRLTLTSGGTRVRLTDEKHVQAQHPIPLEGSSWTLESLVQGETASSVPGPAPTLVIEGKTVRVFTGCNRGSGTIDVGADTLVVSGLALGQRKCPGSTEETVLAVLGSEIGYEQDYDTLTLFDVERPKSSLVFKAQSR